MNDQTVSKIAKISANIIVIFRNIAINGDPGHNEKHPAITNIAPHHNPMNEVYSPLLGPLRS